MIIAGTGHRPNKLGGYSDQALAHLYNIALRWLAEYKHPTSVISGMALGWDQALAKAAILLGIPVIAAIPFQGQELMWPTKSQEEYYNILRRCTDIEYVSSAGYASWKMQRRNEWMVNKCHILLALWDGTHGGTGNCIKYAIKMEKPIVNLYDQFKLAHS